MSYQAYHTSRSAAYSSPLPAKYEGYLPDGMAANLTERYPPTTAAIPSALDHEMLAARASRLSGVGGYYNHSGSTNAVTPLRPNTYVDAHSPYQAEDDGGMRPHRDRSPRANRSPRSSASTPPHPQQPSGGASNVVLDGVSVKNMPYDYVAPAADALRGGSDKSSSNSLFLLPRHPPSPSKRSSSPYIGPAIPSPDRQGGTSTHGGESPTRRALARAIDASNSMNQQQANASASHTVSSSSIAGVSVKNKAYDFVAPHDDQSQTDFRPREKQVGDHTVVIDGITYRLTRASEGTGNSPTAAAAATRRSRSPSQGSIATLRNAVAEASRIPADLVAGRLVAIAGSSSSVASSSIPPSPYHYAPMSTASTPIAGVTVRNEPYDFVGPVMDGGVAGETFASHDLLSQPPSSSEVAKMQQTAVRRSISQGEESPKRRAQRLSNAQFADVQGGSAFINRPHDYAEAVDDVVPPPSADPQHIPSRREHTSVYEPRVHPAVPTDRSDAQPFSSTMPPSLTASYERAAAVSDVRPMMVGSDEGRAPSLTRMVAEIMSHPLLPATSSTASSAAPTPRNGGPVSASAAVPISSEDDHDDLQRYAGAALARVAAASAASSSTKTVAQSASPNVAVSSSSSQPPQPLTRSPTQRPHVDICQVVSTVPNNTTNTSITAGRERYVSPRRQIVSSTSTEAQTLLDTARTTVAMLTEELVGLRREHSHLQHSFADQGKAAAGSKRLQTQVTDLQKQLEQLSLELARERQMRARAEEESKRAVARAEAAAAAEARHRKERSALAERLQAAEQETITVKVTAKAAIDQMAAALSALTTAEQQRDANRQ